MKSGVQFASLVLWLLLGVSSKGQPSLVYGTSSSIQSSNTVQQLRPGIGNTLLFTASGPAGNGVNRCAAVANDSFNGKIFLSDAGGNSLWSLNLNGSGLALVRSNANGAPLGVALDTLNQRLYYSTSS